MQRLQDQVCDGVEVRLRADLHRELIIPFRVVGRKTKTRERLDRIGPSRKARGRPKTVVIDDKAEVARFMEELASANVLLVRVNSLFAGRSTAVAIETVTAGCPLPNTPERTAARVFGAG